MSPPVSTPQISFELHRAAHLMRCRFDRLAGVDGLNRSRWQVLWHLSREEGLKQANLAERLAVAPISLARQVDKLEEEGLVERRRDPSDRRCFRLYLTHKAQGVLEKMRMLGEQTRAEALAGFSDKEVAQLQTLLGRIRANLGGGEEQL